MLSSSCQVIRVSVLRSVQRSIWASIRNAKKWKCCFCVTGEKEPKPQIFRKWKGPHYWDRDLLRNWVGTALLPFSLPWWVSRNRQQLLQPSAKKELLVWHLGSCPGLLGEWLCNFCHIQGVWSRWGLLPAQLFCDMRPWWCQRAARTCSGAVKCCDLHKISSIPIVFTSAFTDF